MRFNGLTIDLNDINKPIKAVYENDIGITIVDDCTIEYVKKLSPMETERLLKDIFGTTRVGVFDCSHMSDEEIERIISE